MKVRAVRKTNVWLFPSAIEKEFSNELADAMATLNDEMNSAFNSLRFDGWVDDLKGITASLKIRAQTLAKPLVDKVSSYFDRTDKFNDTQFMRVVRSATGKVINSSTGVSKDLIGKGLDFYYLRSEEWKTETRQAWIENTQALITKVFNNAVDTYADTIRGGGMAGKAAAAIFDLIKPYDGKNLRKADGVARGAIGYINSILSHKRMQDAGIEFYFWRGKMDDIERKKHVEREGLRFRFDDPPDDGNPGEPYNCRCWAEPDFSGSIFTEN